MARSKADKGRVPLKLKRDVTLEPQTRSRELSQFDLEIEASRARQRKRKEKK